MIVQKLDDETGCYNPFLWNGQVIYGCMPNGPSFICSMVPKYTGLEDDTVYCADANGFKRKKRSATMDGDFENNPDVMVSPSEVNNNKSSSLNHNKHQKPHHNGLFDHKSKFKSNLEMKRQQKGFGSYISHAVFGIKNNNNNKNDHSGSKKKNKGKQHAAKSGQTSRFQVKSDD